MALIMGILMMAGIFFPAAHVGGEGTKTVAFIGFSEGVDQPYWIAMSKGIKAAVKNTSIDLIDLTALNDDPLEQKRMLEYAIETKKVDGIILGANRPSMLMEDLDKATAKGIPVVAVDVDIDHPAVKAFVGTNNFASAQMLGDYIVKATQGKGTVLILGGTQGHPNGNARRAGVEEKVMQAGMKVIFRYADWQAEKGFDITAEELGKPNDIAAIFSCNDPMAVVAEDLVKKKGLQDKIIVVGFDGLEIVLKKIKNGDIKATVIQPIDHMAGESVRLMSDLLSGKTVPMEELVHGVLVDKENVGQFLKD